MEKDKIKIAVLVSGGGTNLQALIDAESLGIIKNGEIKVVISNKEGVYALERAGKAGIEAITILRRKSSEPADSPKGAKERADFQTEFEEKLAAELEKRDIGLIVLAGFMSILTGSFTSKYPGRIINIHPALIPSFCGKGFYGLKVHEAALKYGVKVTGATVHYVNEIPDGGQIIAQKAVEVREGDTPESLQKRVMEQAEWILLPQAAEDVCRKLRADLRE